MVERMVEWQVLQRPTNDAAAARPDTYKKKMCVLAASLDHRWVPGRSSLTLLLLFIAAATEKEAAA